VAFGRTTNILYLLTCVVHYPAAANALIMKLINFNFTPVLPQWRLFSAYAQVFTARCCRMQDKMLYMHIFLRAIDHSQPWIMSTILII